MTRREVDDALAALISDEGSIRPGEQTLERIREPIVRGLKPVRPLAGSAVYTGLFAGLALLVAIAVAALVFGYHPAKAPSLAIICAALALAILVVAQALARLMRPGARSVGAIVAAALALPLLEMLFLVLLHDRGTGGEFFHWGVPCLTAGLVSALPAGLLTWLLMRRGLIVNYAGAGLAIGAMAGLSGLAMLEMHCGNLTLPHVAVWHGGVLAISAGAGLLAGWTFGRVRRLL